jgi:hypothetical protein
MGRNLNSPTGPTSVAQIDLKLSSVAPILPSAQKQKRDCKPPRRLPAKAELVINLLL